MYAVIRSGGKQYRVSPGDVLSVEKLPQVQGGKVEWTEVLAVKDDAGHLRAPAGARVRGTVVAQEKAAKIQVFHYKRKKQYKKLQGHRQQLTRVKVETVELPA